MVAWFTPHPKKEYMGNDSPCRYYGPAAAEKRRDAFPKKQVWLKQLSKRKF